VAFVLLVLLIVGVSIFLRQFVPTPFLVAGGLILVCLYLFGLSRGLLVAVVILFGTVAWAAGYGEPEHKIATTQKYVRADLRDLTAITRFTGDLAALQCTLALRAQEQGQRAYLELEGTLASLSARGTLTPEVRDVLIDRTRRELARTHALTDAMQAALVQLAVRYEPRAVPALWLGQIERRWQRRQLG
jgi:hypothetical protein